MVWTRFMDMSSGGSRKEDFSKLYVEAPEEEAIAIFYNRFGHNPGRVTCTCCGSDYTYDEYGTLEEATEYDRRDGWGDDAAIIPLAEWLKTDIDLKGFTYTGGVRDKFRIIRADEIQSHERKASVPRQGYVWVD